MISGVGHTLYSIIMKKFLLSILGIAIYFIVGWLIKDIVFGNYANPVDVPVMNMMKHEALIYCILAGGYSFIIQCFVYSDSDDNEIGMYLPIGLSVIAYFLLTLLSISTGLIIVFNLLNIAAIIIGCYKDKR